MSNDPTALGNINLEIPNFTGEKGPIEYIEWENAVETLFDLMHYSDLAKIRLVATSFKGYAVSWWRKRNRERVANFIPYESWVQVREDMHLTFRPKSFFYDLERKLQGTVQGTMSVDEYHQTINILLKQGHIHEEETRTVARFLHGLNLEIRGGMSIQRYDTLYEALYAARESEAKIKEMKIYKSNNGELRWNNSRSTPQRCDEHPPPRDDSRDKGKEKVSEVVRPQRDRELICYRCNERGHMARDCLNKRVDKITKQFEKFAHYLENKSEDEVCDHFETPNEHAEAEPFIPLDVEPEYTDSEPSHTLVPKEVLNVHPLKEDESQRENIFCAKGSLRGNTCTVVIGSGSCTSVASAAMLRIFQLPLLDYPNPYPLQWLSDARGVGVTKQVLIPLSINSYFDEILCDITRMQVSHILLGRPWKFDIKISYDGMRNTYVFHMNGVRYVLPTLSPKQVEEIQLRLTQALKPTSKKEEIKESKVEPLCLQLQSPIQSSNSVCSQTKGPQLAIQLKGLDQGVKVEPLLDKVNWSNSCQASQEEVT
ncbi:uncharacterized protein LOC116005809 [Ipomoea triloba]|uniref:uncharacterized protein LOC116005809 n=1 Tax=Ipomoea triloba TaxID=35885 RepID=UPI00125D46D4|nr:uncharacterized protein LOC116005809 [Ipomoea triloba]